MREGYSPRKWIAMISTTPTAPSHSDAPLHKSTCCKNFTKAHKLLGEKLELASSSQSQNQMQRRAALEIVFLSRLVIRPISGEF